MPAFTTVTYISTESIGPTSFKCNATHQRAGGDYPANVDHQGFAYMEGTSGDFDDTNMFSYSYVQTDVNIDKTDWALKSFNKVITGLTPTTAYRVCAYITCGGVLNGWSATETVTTKAMRQIIIISD